MTEEELRQGFLTEADEILSDLQDKLDTLAAGRGDEDLVATLFRGMHSIKGGAAAFRMETIVRLSHAAEDLLDRHRSAGGALGADAAPALQRATDLLVSLVGAERGEAPPPAEVVDAAIAAFAAPEAPEPGFAPLPVTVPEGPDDTAADSALWRIDFAPSRDMFRTANEPILILRALSEMGEVEVDCETRRIPLLDQLEPSEFYLSWRIDLRTTASRTAIEEPFQFVETAADVAITAPSKETRPAPRPSAEAPAGPLPTIRVELDRVDRLMNQVGELVIAQSMLLQELGEAGRSAHGRLGQQLSAFDTLIRDVQQSVMLIRAQPVKTLFQRLARVVRETATETGKAVRLDVEGVETEVDKTVVERLVEPMTHMLRNAVDHGIEDGETRRTAGKPAEGTIALAARQEGGRVVFTISDDGGGLDRSALRRKAADAGVPLPDDASDAEVDALVFASGLSTRDTITDLSGRGVGLDVVREAIAAMGGRVRVTSHPGEGTEFQIVLPLTLAVMDGLLVEAGGQTLVMPLDSVTETRTVAPSDLRPAGPGAEVLMGRDGCVDTIELATALGFRVLSEPAEERVALLAEGRPGERLAYLVDAVTDRRQIVVKPLGGGLPRDPRLSGATILGDGGVALIVDPAGLARHSPNEERARA